MSVRDDVEKAAAPLLEPGEVFEEGTVAAVGNVSTARKVATAAIAAIATAGMLTVHVSAKRRPIALTNRRLLFLDTAGVINEKPTDKLVWAAPRGELRAARKSALLYRVYELTDRDGNPLLRLSFPLPNRAAGDRIAAALGAPSGGSAA
jgi:hypothetical protein